MTERIYPLTDYESIEKAIREAVLSSVKLKECIVRFWTAQTNEVRDTLFKFRAEVPLNDEEAFHLTNEVFNMPFSSDDGKFMIMHSATIPYQDKEQTPSYYYLEFVAQRNCI